MGKEIFIVNSKLVEVNSIVDYDLPSIERLLELSRDEDWEVRCNAIEKISEFPMIFCTDKIKERIRQGLLDINELVQSSCVEVLGQWKDVQSIDKIINCLKDESFVVRIAAAEAIGIFGDSSKVKYLEEYLLQVTDDNEQVFGYFGLFLLGKYHYLENLLESLSSDYYRTRCAVANMLISCVDTKNKQKILNNLRQALTQEKTRAAYSSIKNAIKEIENFPQ